jgi:hypothetical protein
MSAFHRVSADAACCVSLVLPALIFVGCFCSLSTPSHVHIQTSRFGFAGLQGLAILPQAPLTTVANTFIANFFSPVIDSRLLVDEHESKTKPKHRQSIVLRDEAAVEAVSRGDMIQPVWSSFLRAYRLFEFNAGTPLGILFLSIFGHLAPYSPFRLKTFSRRHAFAFVRIAAAACIAVAIPAASAATVVSVDPMNGSDSLGCGLAPPCKSISFALQAWNVSALRVNLTAGIFNESTVNISSFESLHINGVPSATFFDCSTRIPASGAAFDVWNSTIAISGVTFQNCLNPSSDGGAVSARGSSVHVSKSVFINCSAASGGAISATGTGLALFLRVENSSFSGNSANGGLSSCPRDILQPCSSWGGAIAALEIFDVSISGCTMWANNARAFVPPASLQQTASRNALAGGGCVSVLFFGNSSGSSVRIVGNTFQHCSVDVLSGDNVVLGNGVCLHCSFLKRI